MILAQIQPGGTSPTMPPVAFPIDPGSVATEIALGVATIIISGTLGVWIAFLLRRLVRTLRTDVSPAPARSASSLRWERYRARRKAAFDQYGWGGILSTTQMKQMARGRRFRRPT